MKRTFSALLLFVMALMALAFAARADTPFAQHRAFRMGTVHTNRDSLPCREKYELTFDLDMDYDNPFDPEQVDLRVTFISPTEKKQVVNGFLDQPFTRSLQNGVEKWTAAGKPVWTVRFTPNEVGYWQVELAVKNRVSLFSRNQFIGKGQGFEVTPSKNPGFLRVGKTNPRGFAYDNGKPFFAVGENMGWGGQRGTYDYEDWLAALGKAGGNWIRVWMSSNNGALEWSKGAGVGGYHGAGVYALDNAAKVDAILDAAEKNGVATMLCLGTYGEFTTGGFFGEGQWKANPYNKANSGPCEKPEDFWTNETARKLYRQRLRYIAARYGYRTSLHSWEFWNEANPPAEWVKEMAGYLKGTRNAAEPAADPYGHLVSTSYGSDAIWKLPEIDFTMTHSYGMGDIADHAPVIRGAAEQNAIYNKPHLMAEFGIDWRDADIKYDPDGKAVNFHNGLWAGIASGDAGTGMLWWWDNYVAPKNLYAPFAAARKFSDTIHWEKGEWKPAGFDAPLLPKSVETFSDLTVPANGAWGKSAVSDFMLTSQGAAGNPVVPTLLYSPAKAEFRTPTRFHVKMRQAGRFIVRVNTVSNFANLRFLIDDRPVSETRLDAAPPKDKNVKPDYATTKLFAEYGGIYQAQFNNKEIGVDVPAGQHIIELDVSAGDWMSVTGYTVTNYRSSRYAQVSLYGTVSGREAVIWAQNSAHNWKNVFEKKPIAPIIGATVALHDLPAGRYSLTWWDTWSGVPLKTETADCNANGLLLRLPPLERDAALHIVAYRH